MKFRRLFKESKSTKIIQTKQWLDEMGIENYIINDNGTVDVDGNVNLSRKRLTDISVKFRKVSGGFTCTHNKLTSLAGCPKEVGLYFDCGHNNLTSLAGCPKVIPNNFNCISNQLTSLVGGPEYVKGYFNCASNGLTTLEGAPEYVGKSFHCYNNAKDFTKEEVMEVTDVRKNMIKVSFEPNDYDEPEFFSTPDDYDMVGWEDV